MEGRMKFTASGDALIMRNFPENYEGYEAVKDFIGQGEARITNLETTLTERDCFPSTFFFFFLINLIAYFIYYL